MIILLWIMIILLFIVIIYLMLTVKDIRLEIYIEQDKRIRGLLNEVAIRESAIKELRKRIYILDRSLHKLNDNQPVQIPYHLHKTMEPK